MNYLEKCVPGITAAPGFQTRTDDSCEETVSACRTPRIEPSRASRRVTYLRDTGAAHEEVCASAGDEADLRLAGYRDVDGPRTRWPDRSLQ